MERRRCKITKKLQRWRQIDRGLGGKEKRERESEEREERERERERERDERERERARETEKKRKRKIHREIKKQRDGDRGL